MALSWPAKDPEEVLDFPVDFTKWITAPAQLDTGLCVIESKIGDDTSNPLLIDLVVELNDIVTVWLSGGVDGVKYVFKVTATDDNITPSDRTVVRRVKLTCKEK